MIQVKFLYEIPVFSQNTYVLHTIKIYEGYTSVPICKCKKKNFRLFASHSFINSRMIYKIAIIWLMKSSPKDC